MGNGGGRDIWTLTSNLGSLISYNTTARLKRTAGLARGVSPYWSGQKVKMQIQDPTAHWIKLGKTIWVRSHRSLSVDASITGLNDSSALTWWNIYNVKCSSAPLSNHLETRQLWQQKCISHQGHWWCRYRSELAAGWWAALVVLPHGNTAGNPGQPQILGRFASVPQWRCS